MPDKEKQINIGGQAVIEGVVMRGKKTCFMAVRKPDSTIEIVEQKVSGDDKNKFLKLPVVRGVVSFIESLAVGIKTIMQSAEISGMESEDDKIPEAMFVVTAVVAVAFSIVLFMLLPVWLGSLLNKFLRAGTMLLSVIEGVTRIALFLFYVFLISRMKDIKRVFEYHGAEHKTINCYEAGGELTPETVRGYSRLHKRCGTSFLLIVMIISMLVFMFLRTETVWLRVVSRVLLIPVIAGLSYEVIKWAGRNDSAFVRAISFPGMALQKFTTREPDDSQIEIAIAAASEVLARDFPEDNAR